VYLQQELAAKHQHHIYIHIKIQPTTKRTIFFHKNYHLCYGTHQNFLRVTARAYLQCNHWGMRRIHCCRTGFDQAVAQLFHQDFDPSPTLPSCSGTP
jgi:hypothetical protein